MNQLRLVQILRRIDIIGCLLLLSASTLLVAGLEEATIQPWSSPSVVTLIAISTTVWPCFIAWEWQATRWDGIMEPVFPTRFVQSRVILGLLSNTLFLGVIFTVCVVHLPLKFQATNGASPLWAGVHLLPFTLAVPTGIMTVAFFTKPGRNVPPIMFLLLGATLQTIGAVLMSTVPTRTIVWTGQYGYEVVTGLGVGFSLGAASIVAPFTITKSSDLCKRPLHKSNDSLLIHPSPHCIRCCSVPSPGWYLGPCYGHLHHELLGQVKNITFFIG